MRAAFSASGANTNTWSTFGYLEMHCELRPMMTHLPSFAAPSVTLAVNCCSVSRSTPNSGPSPTYDSGPPALAEALYHSLPPCACVLVCFFGPGGVYSPHRRRPFDDLLSTHTQPSISATLRPMSDPPLPYSLAIVTTLNTLHPRHCHEQLPLPVSTICFASFLFRAPNTSMHRFSFWDSLTGLVFAQEECT